jgi:hypothetical protein
VRALVGRCIGDYIGLGQRRSVVMRARLSVVLLGSLLVLAGCEPPPPAGPPANPYPPVPPPLTEARPLPPVSEAQLVWRLGDWQWNGATYTWRPGDWEPLDSHSSQFLRGHWELQGMTWVWVPGHWL